MVRQTCCTLLLLLWAVPVQAATFYVNPAYAGTETGTISQPYNTIQEGINATSTGDEVHACTGTFANMSATLPNRTITLRGGYNCTFTERNYSVYPTVLDGAASNAVLRQSASAGTFTIEGFTISGSTARGVEFDCSGGGSTINCTVTLVNVIIENNTSGSNGGGCFFRNSAVTMRHVVIRNNTGAEGGGCVVTASDVSDSTFNISFTRMDSNENTGGHGGGWYLVGTGTFTDNHIVSNESGINAGFGWGGGLIIVGVGSVATFSRNVWYDNIAYTIGAAVFVDDGAVVTADHEVIHSNRAGPSYRGGAILVDGLADNGSSGSTYTCDACTVANNAGGSNSGGGIYLERGSVGVLTNSIFWGNGGPGNDNGWISPSSIMSTLAWTYSNTQDTDNTGTGMVHSDPLFVSSAGDNYRLQAGSPSRDTGDPASPFSSEPSGGNGRADMGVYSNTNPPTYRVGPSRDNDQITDVTGVVVAGDVIDIDGDTIYNAVTITRPGASGNVITWRGTRINSIRPTIQGNEVNGYTLYVRTTTPQNGYHAFSGLEITDGTQACVRYQARDSTFTDVKIYNCDRHGLLGHDFNTGSLTLSYVEVTGAGCLAAACPAENLKHPVYMTTDQQVLPGSIFRVENSYIHDNRSGNAIKTRSQRNEIYYNWIQTEGEMVYALEMIGPDTDAEGQGLDCDSDIVGNVFLGHSSYLSRFGSDGHDNTNGHYRWVNNTMIQTSPNFDGVIRAAGVIASVEAWNNIVWSFNASSARFMRQDGTWEGGSEDCSGGHNWIMNGYSVTGSACAGLITGATRGTNPGFTSFANFATIDPRLTDVGAARNIGSATTTGSVTFPIPTPLTTFSYHPPYRLDSSFTTLTQTARPADATIDAGAFEQGEGGGGAVVSPRIRIKLRKEAM